MQSVVPLIFILWHGSPIPPQDGVFLPPPEEIVLCSELPDPKPYICPTEEPEDKSA